MTFKIVLSEFMDQQVQTKPPVEGFESKKEALSWAFSHYGSAGMNARRCTLKIGYEIKEV